MIIMYDENWNRVNGSFQWKVKKGDLRLFDLVELQIAKIRKTTNDWQGKKIHKLFTRLRKGTGVALKISYEFGPKINKEKLR